MYFSLDCDSNQLPLAIVQYSFFDGEVVPVKIEPHGNAKKSKRPHFRTQHSTLTEIKETVSKLSPTAAIKHVYDEAGGIINAKSLSEIPRDRRQAYNIKSHKQSTSGIASNHNKDLTYDLLEQHYGSLNRLCVIYHLMTQLCAYFVMNNN